MSKKRRIFRTSVFIVCAVVALAKYADAHDEKDMRHVKSSNYKAAPQSSSSAAGEILFKKNNCAQCHSTSQGGGCLGPLLTGVGGRRSRQFLLDRITAGRNEENSFAEQYGHAELMRHPRLARAEASQVVAYLLTLPEPAKGYSLKGHNVKPSKPAIATKEQIARPAKLSPESVAKGRQLFYEAGCMACHSIGKIGGQFANPLDDIGTRKGRTYVSERMTGAEMLTLGTNDEYNARGTMMPPSALSSDQIESISDFLMSLSEKN